jgi:hypothetical protein
MYSQSQRTSYEYTLKRFSREADFLRRKKSASLIPIAMLRDS